MMKIKKLLSVVLIGLIAAALLTGCGTDTSGSQEDAASGARPK